MIVYELLSLPDLTDPRHTDTLGAEAPQILSERAFRWFELLYPQLADLRFSIRYTFDPARPTNTRLRIFLSLSSVNEEELADVVEIGFSLFAESFNVRRVSVEQSIPVSDALQNFTCICRKNALLEAPVDVPLLSISSGLVRGESPSTELDSLLCAVNEESFIEVQVCKADATATLHALELMNSEVEQLEDRNLRQLYGSYMKEWEEFEESLRIGPTAVISVVAGSKRKGFAASLVAAFGSRWLGTSSLELRWFDQSHQNRVLDMIELGSPFFQLNEISEVSPDFWEQLTYSREGSKLGTESFSHHIAGICSLPQMFGAEHVRVALSLPVGSTSYLRSFPNEDELATGHHSPEIRSVPGVIELGTASERNMPLQIPCIDLTRHVFVTGVTGSGKSVTMFNILRQLSEQDIPILILEPAKSEYRNLIKDLEFCQSLSVISAGKGTSPLKINLFRIPDHISVAEHIANLMTVFSAAMPLEDFLPTILEEALYQLYESKGWAERDLGNSNRRTLPEMSDVLKYIDTVIDSLKYGDEVAGNCKGAFMNRFTSFKRGIPGQIFSGATEWPNNDQIFRGTSLIELEALSVEHANLVSLAILMMVRQKLRELGPCHSGPRLVLVLEEAHNLVPQSASVTKPMSSEIASSRFICRLLTEMRAMGLAVIVVDQSPAAVAAEVLRSTNLKIAHRTTAKDDRDSLASAMLLDGARTENLARLKRGQAFIYGENLSRPLLANLPIWMPGGGDSRDVEVTDAHLVAVQELRDVTNDAESLLKAVEQRLIGEHSGAQMTWDEFALARTTLHEKGRAAGQILPWRKVEGYRSHISSALKRVELMEVKNERTVSRHKEDGHGSTRG